MRIFNLKIKKIASFLALFSASLSLTSPYGALISWIIIPCVVLLFNFSKNINKSKIFIFLFLSFFIILINCFSYELSSYQDRFLVNIALVVFGLGFSFYSIDLKFINNVELIFDKLILIHVILFIFQFISFYLLKINIDYNVMTGGIGSRNEWDFLYRASGIYDEPAVFCMHMAALIVLRLLISKDNTFICKIALVCMCLSFSFVGIFQSFCLFVLMNKSFNYKKIFSMIFIFIILFLLFGNIFHERFNQFSDGDDGSNNTKIFVINEFFDNMDLMKYGYGFVGYRADYPLHYQGIYDLTFFGANITIYGIFFGLLINFAFLFFLFKSKFSFKEILMIFVVLIKISTPTFMIYWFFFVCIFFINRNRILMCTPKNRLDTSQR